MKVARCVSISLGQWNLPQVKTVNTLLLLDDMVDISCGGVKSEKWRVIEVRNDIMENIGDSPAVIETANLNRSRILLHLMIRPLSVNRGKVIPPIYLAKVRTIGRRESLRSLQRRSSIILCLPPSL